MPQTGKYTAADIAPAQQQGAYSAADIASPNPDSFFGGAVQRLKDIAMSQQQQSIGDTLKNAPWFGPIPQALAGVAKNVKQLGPQLVQQAKQGAASHQPGDILPNLYDARTAVTAASMLDPFASGSVANVNRLQDQGRPRDAAGQGSVDAALLTAGLAAPTVIPKVAAPVTRTAIRVANKALTPASVGAAGGGLVAGPFGAAVGAETLPEMFPTWTSRAQKGVIPTPEWAAKPTPQLQLFRNMPKVSANLEGQTDITQQLPFLKKSQPPAPQQVAEQSVASASSSGQEIEPGSGTWSRDPRTGEQILEDLQNRTRGGGQGKVAMGVNQEQAAQQSAKRPPVQSPVSQEPSITTSGDMTGYYGKTSGRSNLKANQRQLASPTGSTAPVPVSTEGPHPPDIMKILNTPGDISDADLAKVQSYFAQKRFTNMLLGNAMQKAAGQ